MENFKDESFILQYLSPKVIRDLKLFTLFDDSGQEDMEITAIHDDKGYQSIRESLAADYNLSEQTPNIQILKVDVRGDRSLTLLHQMRNHQPLDKYDCRLVLDYLQQLWHFDVRLESVDNDELENTYVSTRPLEESSP